MKLAIIILFILLAQPIQAAKIISTVNSTVETDISGLTGGTMPSSAIIMPNGTMYDAYTDDGLLISSQDFDLVYDSTIDEIGVGDIVLRAGEYKYDDTLDIWQGISLRGEKGTILVPAQNIDMVRMHPGSSLSGIALEPRRLAGYGHAAIHISSEDPWSDFFPAAYRYQIEDIDMWGVGGTALLLDATGTPGYNPDNGVGGYICGVVAKNINILGFDDGLLLRCDTENSFINGNKFEDFHFTGTTYSARCEATNGGSRNNIDGNIFSDFHVQYTPGMELAFDIAGRYNRISAMIWDWLPDVAVVFQNDTGQNYALLGVDRAKIDDQGVQDLETRNTIVGYI